MLSEALADPPIFPAIQPAVAETAAFFKKSRRE